MFILKMRVRAFTIIELLVVVAIIGLLVGLLLPALAGVKRRSAKTNELNNLKHIGHAWMMYANHNNDAALPGFLQAAVQADPVPGTSNGWGVMYKYPDQMPIPNDPVNIPGPWPWRLLPYVDYNHELVHGYLEEDDTSVISLIAEAEKVAFEPGFGYNGYYLGGYWEMYDDGGIQSPRYRYWDHCGSDDIQMSIPTSLSQIGRSSEIVAFCSSAQLEQGTHFRIRLDTPGSHLVVPPWLGDEQQWGPDPVSGEHTTVHVYASGGAMVPVARHTSTAAVLYCDGHLDSQAPGALLDQQKWINTASTRDYTHAPCP